MLDQVDPETGVKDVGGEPMKTLRTYRTSLCPEEREVPITKTKGIA